MFGMAAVRVGDAWDVSHHAANRYICIYIYTYIYIYTIIYVAILYILYTVDCNRLSVTLILECIIQRVVLQRCGAGVVAWEKS